MLHDLKFFLLSLYLLSSCYAPSQQVTGCAQGQEDSQRVGLKVVCRLFCAGRGAVYTYDAIGSYERTGYSCQGSGKDLMQPVLDNQLKAASPLLVPPRVSEQFVCVGEGAVVMAVKRMLFQQHVVKCWVRQAAAGPSPGPALLDSKKAALDATWDACV